MAKAVDQLVQQIKGSGRLPESEDLRSIFASIIEQAGKLDLGPQFPRRTVKAALQTADPRSAMVRMTRLLSSVDDPNFYSLLEDPDYAELKPMVGKARGVLIFPRLLKGGFIGHVV